MRPAVGSIKLYIGLFSLGVGDSVTILILMTLYRGGLFLARTNTRS